MGEQQKRGEKGKDMVHLQNYSNMNAFDSLIRVAYMRVSVYYIDTRFYEILNSTMLLLAKECLLFNNI